MRLSSCNDIWSSKLGTILTSRAKGKENIDIPSCSKKDLPSQAAATLLSIPSLYEIVKDSLSKNGPARFVGRVGKLELSTLESSHGPETDVVVTQGLRGILGFVVVLIAGLPSQGLGADIVEGGIASVIPVVHERTEETRALPPVVTIGLTRVGEVTGSIAR